MRREELESLAGTRDFSQAAISRRLIAARKVAGHEQLKTFARMLGIPYQTYYSQETRGAPSLEVVDYLMGAHGIDFNFIFHGDFVHLPLPLQRELFAALAAERGQTFG